MDGLRVREERVAPDTVVHVMRWALGYEGPATRLAWLDDELRRGRAAGLMTPQREAELLLQKAHEHEAV